MNVLVASEAIFFRDTGRMTLGREVWLATLRGIGRTPDSRAVHWDGGGNWQAWVAELVDAPDSKSGSFGSVGSIPTLGTS